MPTRYQRTGSGWDELDLADRGLVRAGEEWNSDLHRIASEQFNKAADVLELAPGVCASGCAIRAAR